MEENPNIETPAAEQQLEGQQQAQAPVVPDPVWKRMDPSFESEDQAVESYTTIKAKAADLEQRLSSVDTTPKYKSDLTRRLDQIVSEAIDGGADDKSAMARAREYFNAQSRDYEAEAGANPMAVMLEKYRAENPGLSDERLRKVIENQYGLSARKPGEDATEDEIAAYEDNLDLGRTRLEIDARKHGREMNDKKEVLGLSPEAVQMRQDIDRKRKALEEFMPKAMQAFSRQASSLKATVDGVEIDFSDYAAPGGRMSAEFESIVRSFDPSLYSVNGVVDENRVQDIGIRVAMYLNPQATISRLLKMGADRNAREATEKKLNLVPPGTTQAPEPEGSESLKASYQRLRETQGR